MRSATPAGVTSGRMGGARRQVAQPLTEGYKVYTIGLNQILAIFHREAHSILPVWKISRIFLVIVLVSPPTGRTGSPIPSIGKA